MQVSHFLSHAIQGLCRLLQFLSQLILDPIKNLPNLLFLWSLEKGMTETDILISPFTFRYELKKIVILNIFLLLVHVWVIHVVLC